MINADNGPENSGSRTQWLKRMVEFAAAHRVDVHLAYYPPYHSKYNPIERVFGVLENYWNGDPLRSVAMAMQMAEGMTYKKVHPKAAFYGDAYPAGVKLTKKEMEPYEQCLERLDGQPKWFIKISSKTAAAMLASLSN